MLKLELWLLLYFPRVWIVLLEAFPIIQIICTSLLFSSRVQVSYSDFAISWADTLRVNLSAMHLMRLHVLPHLNLSSATSKNVLVSYQNAHTSVIHVTQVEPVLPFNIEVTVQEDGWVGVGLR